MTASNTFYSMASETRWIWSTSIPHFILANVISIGMGIIPKLLLKTYGVFRITWK